MVYTCSRIAQTGLRLRTPLRSDTPHRITKSHASNAIWATLLCPSHHLCLAARAFRSRSCRRRFTRNPEGSIPFNTFIIPRQNCETCIRMQLVRRPFGVRQKQVRCEPPGTESALSSQGLCRSAHLEELSVGADQHETIGYHTSGQQRMALQRTSGKPSQLLPEFTLPEGQSRSLPCVATRTLNARSSVRGGHRRSSDGLSRSQTAHPAWTTNRSDHATQRVQVALRTGRPRSFRSRSEKVWLPNGQTSH